MTISANNLSDSQLFALGKFAQLPAELRKDVLHEIDHRKFSPEYYSQLEVAFISRNPVVKSVEFHWIEILVIFCIPLICTIFGKGIPNIIPLVVYEGFIINKNSYWFYLQWAYAFWIIVPLYIGYSIEIIRQWNSIRTDAVGSRQHLISPHLLNLRRNTYHCPDN